MSPLKYATALALLVFTPSCGVETPASNSSPSRAAQAPSSPTSAQAQISFARTSHDFGRISDLELATTEFRFTNTGAQQLSIKGIKASCGCTTADLETTEFAPGAGDVIKVEWKPKGFGVQSQTVKVTSNDPKQGLVTLSVRAEVEPTFRLGPARVALGHARLGAEHTAQVRVLSEAKGTVLAAATCTSPHIEITARPGAEAGDTGAHSVIDIRVLPTAPKGRFFSTAKLVFEGPGLGEVGSHTMSLPITATFYEHVRAEPDVFAVGLVPRGGQIQHSIHLKSDRPFEVVFSEVLRCPVPLQVIPRPYVDGDEFAVELILRGEANEYVGTLGGTVSVTTDILEEGPLTFLLMGKVDSK